MLIYLGKKRNIENERRQQFKLEKELEYTSPYIKVDYVFFLRDGRLCIGGFSWEDEAFISIYNLQTREIEIKLKGYTRVFRQIIELRSRELLSPNSMFDSSLRIWDISNPSNITYRTLCKEYAYCQYLFEIPNEKVILIWYNEVSTQSLKEPYSIINKVSFSRPSIPRIDAAYFLKKRNKLLIVTGGYPTDMESTMMLINTQTLQVESFVSKPESVSFYKSYELNEEQFLIFGSGSIYILNTKSLVIEKKLNFFEKILSELYSCLTDTIINGYYIFYYCKREYYIYLKKKYEFYKNGLSLFNLQNFSYSELLPIDQVQSLIIKQNKLIVFQKSKIIIYNIQF